MNKIIEIHEAVSKVKDGMTIMISGFIGLGAANQIIQAVSDAGVKDLTVIANDSAYPDKSLGLLIARKQVKKLIVSHLGTNPAALEQFSANEIEVEFCPQGTLVERVRAKGAGLGGVLTQTGLGTLVQEGKEVVVVDGKEYLLEKPLGADLALLGASIADRKGNLRYLGTSHNFNSVMAMAADLVIVEADKIVEVGQLEPDTIHTPGILVDYIYKKI